MHTTTTQVNDMACEPNVCAMRLEKKQARATASFATVSQKCYGPKHDAGSNPLAMFPACIIHPLGCRPYCSSISSSKSR